MMLSMAAAAFPDSSLVTRFAASRTVCSAEVPVAVFFTVSATCSSVNEAQPRSANDVMKPHTKVFFISAPVCFKVFLAHQYELKMEQSRHAREPTVTQKYYTCVIKFYIFIFLAEYFLFILNPLAFLVNFDANTHFGMDIAMVSLR